ncbi:transposase [bacterium]|nr:transposase [bacterium]
MAATVGDARRFRSGRQFAAWLNAAAELRRRERLGRIIKIGDHFLLKLLVIQRAHATCEIQT